MSSLPNPNAPATAWDSARGDSGLRFWDSWLADEESKSFGDMLNDEAASDFPWDLKPKLYGTELPQHAYYYQRSGSEPVARGLTMLEDLCVRIEKGFECKVQGVYCNRFADPSHEIVWHKDEFGSHIFVLSVGAPRVLEFRVDKTGEKTRYEPRSGDLYFMSLDHNKAHHHRVCAAEPNGDQGVRCSFVFFATAPFNKKEYRIGLLDRLRGWVEGRSSGV